MRIAAMPVGRTPPWPGLSESGKALLGLGFLQIATRPFLRRRRYRDSSYRNLGVYIDLSRAFHPARP